MPTLLAKNASVLVYTVIRGRVVVENGQVVTVNMRPVIDAHNRFAQPFAGQS